MIRRSILSTLLLIGALTVSATVFAQNDFTGEWQPVRNQDNSENPQVGDWIGIPLNEAGLARSEAWDASIQSLPEWQCRPHGWAYIYRGPTALRIWKDVDPYTREVTAFHAQWQQAAETPIYLDGRPDPPDYAHQGRLPAPQRHLRQRQGDRHDVLEPARRLPDMDQHRSRSRLSHRAA